MRYLKSSKKFDLDQSILAWRHLRGIMLTLWFFVDFYSFDFNKAVGMNNFFIYISERYFLRGSYFKYLPTADVKDAYRCCHPSPIK